MTQVQLHFARARVFGAAIVVGGLVALVGIVTMRRDPRAGSASFLDVPIRSAPLQIAAHDSHSLDVNFTDLAAVLDRARPRRQERPMEIQEILHGLRLWGSDFQSDGCCSSQEMLRILLDTHAYRVYFHATATAPALLRRKQLAVTTERQGFETRVRGGKTAIGTAPHFGKFFQVMAEVGLSSRKRVVVDGHDFQLGDGIRVMLADFTLADEVEFAAIASAQWLPPTSEWQNRHGQVLSFNSIAQRLVKQETDGACSNIHRLYALAVLLRVNSQYHILSDECQGEVEGALAKASDLLNGSLGPNGLWNMAWADPSIFGRRLLVTPKDEILVTGHHLEWIALVPERLRPKKELVKLATASLAATLANTDPALLTYCYGPVTHAARALCLLAGVSPTEFLARDVAGRLETVSVK